MAGGVHLRDDELIDIEEFRKPLLGQIGLQAAVRKGPTARLEVGLYVSVAPFGLELDGLEDARDGTRGEGGGVDEEVRSGQIVAEQRRRLAVRTGHRDVEYPPRQIERLQECDVPGGAPSGREME